MKKNISPKVKPNPKLFVNTTVGRQAYKPLQHKDGSLVSDLEYFELLGRKCIEMDKMNKNPNLPTDYGRYDKTTCLLAKEICKGIDNGLSHDELQSYLNSCINYEE